MKQLVILISLRFKIRGPATVYEKNSPFYFQILISYRLNSKTKRSIKIVTKCLRFQKYLLVALGFETRLLEF